MGPPRPRGEPECDPPPRPSRRLTWGPRRTGAAQIVPREAGLARTGVVWEATPPMDSTTPVTPALLPAQGRQRDGKRQSDPPPYGPRPGRTAGGNGAPPPPPQPTPPDKNAMDPPRGAQPPQGQSRAPTPARPRPQRGPRQPTQWTSSRGRRTPDPRRPTQRSKAPPGDALPPPPQPQAK